MFYLKTKLLPKYLKHFFSTIFLNCKVLSVLYKSIFCKSETLYQLKPKF